MIIWQYTTLESNGIAVQRSDPHLTRVCLGEDHARSKSVRPALSRFRGDILFRRISLSGEDSDRTLHGSDDSLFIRLIARHIIDDAPVTQHRNVGAEQQQLGYLGGGNDHGAAFLGFFFDPNINIVPALDVNALGWFVQ